MSSEWRSPQGEAQLTGTVVYRCAACGADIDDEPAWWRPGQTADVYLKPLGDTLTPDYRTYHPTHLPVTED